MRSFDFILRMTHTAIGTHAASIKRLKSRGIILFYPPSL